MVPYFTYCGKSSEDESSAFQESPIQFITFPHCFLCLLYEAVKVIICQVVFLIHFFSKGLQFFFLSEVWRRFICFLYQGEKPSDKQAIREEYYQAHKRLPNEDIHLSVLNKKYQKIEISPALIRT